MSGVVNILSLAEALYNLGGSFSLCVCVYFCARKNVWIEYLCFRVQ